MVGLCPPCARLEKCASCSLIKHSLLIPSLLLLAMSCCPLRLSFSPGGYRLALPRTRLLCEASRHIAEALPDMIVVWWSTARLARRPCQFNEACVICARECQFNFGWHASWTDSSRAVCSFRVCRATTVSVGAGALVGDQLSDRQSNQSNESFARASSACRLPVT